MHTLRAEEVFFLTPFGVLGVGPKMITQGVQKRPCEMQQVALRGVEGYTSGTTLCVSHTRRIHLGSKSTPHGVYLTPHGIY